MSYLNTVDGYPYFKFDHNLHYQDVQKEFMRAVDTLNPDNIVSILRLHPYHIDSHIQLSDMAKSAEDMSVGKCTPACITTHHWYMFLEKVIVDRR